MFFLKRFSLSKTQSGLLAWFAATCLFSLPAQAIIPDFSYERITRQTEEKTYQKFIEKTPGIVDLHDIDPNLEKALESLSQRLTSAMKTIYEKTEGNTFPVRRNKTLLRVVEDPEINAYYFSYYEVKKRGLFIPYLVDDRALFFRAMKKAKYVNMQNCVAITTGFLMNLLKNPQDTDLLAALIAHELKHGIQNYSLKGIGNRNQASSTAFKFDTLQAKELDADEEGRAILSEARIDPSAMNRLQKILYDMQDRKNAGSLAAVAASGAARHPEQTFRETWSRVTAVLERYEEGWNSPEPITDQIPLSSVQKLPRKDHSLFPVDLNRPFENGAELFASFDHYFNFSVSANADLTENNIRFNYLIFEFDRLLRENKLDEQEGRRSTAWLLARLTSMNRKTDNGNEFETPQIKQKRPAILGEIPGFYFQDNFSRAISHEEAMNASAYLRTPEFMQDFLHELEQVSPRHFQSLSESLSPLQEDPIKIGVPATHRLEYLKKIPNLLSKLNIYEVKAAVDNEPTRDFILKLSATLPLTDRTAFFSYLAGLADHNPAILSKLFIFLQHEELGPMIAWKNAKWADPFTDTSPEFNELAKKIWANRAAFGVAEMFLSNDRRLRWEWIFKSVGISESEGLLQLRQSMQSYFQSESYRHFFRNLRDAMVGEDLKPRVFGNALANLTDQAMIWPKKNRVWLNEGVLSLLDGSGIQGISEYEIKLLRSTLSLRGFQLDPDLFRKKLKERFQFYFAQNRKKNLTAEKVQRIWSLAFEDVTGPLAPRHLSNRNNSNDFGPYTFRHDSDFLKGMSLPEQNLFFGTIKWRTHFLYDLPDFSDILLDVISASEMPLEEKKEAVQLILLEPAQLVFAQADPLRNPKVFTSPRFSEVVQKAKAMDLEFKTLGNASHYTPEERRNFYRNGGDTLVNRIQEQVSKSDGYEGTLKLFQAGWPSGIQKIASPEATSVKTKLAELLGQTKSLSSIQKLTLMAILTRDGATAETDAELLKLLPALSENQFLEYRNLKGDFASEITADAWVRAWVNKIKGGGKHLSLSQFEKIVTEIPQIIPTPNFSRDQLLEEISWDCPTASDTATNALEKLKTSEIDPFSVPHQVNVASMLSSYLQGFSETEIEEWIWHVQEHPGEAMTEPMRKKLWRRLINDSSSLSMIRKMNLQGMNPPSDAELADWGVRTTDDFLISLRGDDRIPLLDHLMHSGKNPITKNTEFFLSFAQKFLGYAADSNDTKKLRAFLASIPEHEYSTTMAYLSAKKATASTQNKISPLIEPFKTPGKKGAQLYAIFRLGDEESVAEAASFKSSAKPMSKSRFKQILKSDLPPREYQQIVAIELVKAASLKTVARLTLSDGSTLIGTAIDPRADQQNYTHMNFLKKFILNLEKEGIFADAAVVKYFLDCIERQLKFETDQPREARILNELSPLMQKINQKFAAEWNGWKVAVPQISSRFTQGKNTLFMSEVSGVGFDELPVEVQAQAGKIVIDTSLALIYLGGRAEGDPHVKNILVDAATKTVSLIDKGQDVKLNTSEMRLKSDDRLQISLFLLALSQKNAEKMVTAAIAMSTQTQFSTEDRQRIYRAVKDFLQNMGSPSAQTAIELFKVLINEGLILEDKFSVGFLKGLMTLERENYVTPLDFQNHLQKNVAAFLPKKAIPTILEFCKAKQLANPGLPYFDCITDAYRELKALEKENTCNEDLKAISVIAPE